MMSEERRDSSLLIGLHKLAEQNGDGLVPELYALLAGRRDAPADMTNVVPMPSRTRSTTQVTSQDETGQVLAFRRS